MSRAVVLGALLCAVSGSALAAPATSVFPFSAPNLPMRIADAPEELAKSLANALDADLQKIPIDDAATTLECDPEAQTCLSSVAKYYKSKRLVFGSIAMVDENKLKVTLVKFESLGPDRSQRSFTVEGDVEEMSAQLVQLSRPLFADKEAPVDDPIETPPIDGPTETTGGSISGATWGILGTGVLAAAVGGVFFYKAHGISEEVATLPRNTSADFDRLTARENKGSQYMVIGGVLTAAGGAVIVYGLIRAVSERSHAASKPSEPAVSFRPVAGGGALVYTMELP